MFGFGTILYLFAAGAGAGLYVVQACVDPSNALRTRGPRDAQLLVRKLIIVAPVLVCVGSMFLVLDLSRPDRFFLVFRNPDTSLISLGACLIVLFVALSAMENALWNSSGLTLARVVLAVRAAAFLAAIGVILYTGFFLMSMRAVPLWHSAFIVLLFTASSLSSGLALLMLLYVASFRRSHMPLFMRRASQVDTALLVVELALLVGFVGVQFGGAPAAIEAGWRLLVGDVAWAFWIMLVGVGLLCPLVIDVVKGKTPAPAAFALKAITVLVGCFFLRYCIMEAGVRVLSLQ